ncbi:MAG: tRNA (adenosine(37)-N6)-threonylcarbamoyltransferase complex dimerization subunit type 1 TsaB [Clostridiaceae bacterium]|nr:tRNA (adenosine(37)-N6)-threonylcarbamoyltransferase complex dimerization subunit type 1 TsaB [Clostridiaceae bacterium]
MENQLLSNDFYLLAFDTSGKSLSIAILKQDQLLAEKFLNINNQHSVNFLPALKGLLEETNLSFNDISALAVSIGPGSFTGIRIGVSTANTMAFDLNIPIFGISSLKALAEPLLSTDKYLLPAFDARGGRVYATLLKDGEIMIDDRQFVDNDLVQLLNEKKLQNKKILTIGDGRETVNKLLGSAGFSNISQIQNNDHLNYISAESIARLALKQIQTEPDILMKKFQNPIVPEYCAITQAERNLKKNKN